MGRADGVAALLLAAYFIAATYGGKWKELAALLRRDYLFVPWIVALGILYLLRSNTKLKGPVGMLIAAGFIGMILFNYRRFESEAKYAWAFIGGKAR